MARLSYGKRCGEDAVARFFLLNLPANAWSEWKGVERVAHYWARVPTAGLAMRVRLISPQFVTPYVKSKQV